MESVDYGGVTRTTVFVALFVAMLMLWPGPMIGNHDVNPVDSAAAQTSDRVLRVGWPDFAGTLITLNPHTMTMGQEYMLILPCYSYLLGVDIDGETTGNLAQKYTISPDGKVYHFWLTHNATFYDKYRVSQGLQLIPVTADDVIFSFWLTQNHTDSINNYYLPELPGSGGGLIYQMNKINDYELEMILRGPFAPFMEGLKWIPILPKYIWQNHAWDWDNEGDNNNPCVGSGWMYYGLNSLRAITSIGQAEMYANPYYFGTIEYGLQVRCHKMILRSETQASGILNYNAGNLDVLIWPTSDQYSIAKGYKVSSNQGLILDVCMNQLSVEDRQAFGVGGPSDWNNQLLRDPIVKRAIRMCVNKTAVVEFSLDGQGQPGDSFVPSMNSFYYHYGSKPGEIPIPNDGDIPGARTLLMANGWKFRSTSPYAELKSSDSDYNTYYPLAKVGGTEVLSFRYAYCDWYDFILDEGPRIQAWCRSAGIDLVGGPESNNVMGTLWYTADYDVYLWDWWFNPMSVADLDCMEVITTAEIGGQSDVNDHNETFDEWYYRSVQEVNPDYRKILLENMQRWVYENSGYWPVAWGNVLYLMHDQGVNGDTVVTPQQWTNWGDWIAQYPLTIDSNHPWLFYQIEPGNNHGPKISTLNYDPEFYTGELKTFSAQVSDDHSSLEYRWNWGDGTNTTWSSAWSTATHSYARDGYYTAWFMAREVGSADGFISNKHVKVKIVDASNDLPSGSFSIWPTDPDQGTPVMFNGTGSDPDLDPLAYSWDFGDGYTGLGQNVTHQFKSGTGSGPWNYQVTMFVDDMRFGDDPRPYSSSNYAQVKSNGPPTITVPNYLAVPWGTSPDFSVLASDPNLRDHLRFTWYWGDDSVTVTTDDQTESHKYPHAKDYTLTVFVDDLTGLPGHNVSNSGGVHVYRGTNNAPALVSFTASTQVPMLVQPVIFSARVTDADGDVADVVFDFGDGTPPETVTQTTPNTTVSVAHSYLDLGEFYPSLTYTDGVVAPIPYYPTWWVTVNDYYTLKLQKGWNFVSVPVLNATLKASTLGLRPGDVVFSFNCTTQTYDKNYIAGGPIFKDFFIEENTGYWIAATAAENLYLNGSMPTKAQIKTVDVPSGGGWVCLGFNSLRVDMHASDIPAMYTGGTVKVVESYLPATGTWKVYNPALPFTDFLLAPGQAYWIGVSGDGDLRYEPW